MLALKIDLSQRSQALLNHYFELYPTNLECVTDIQESVSMAQLIALLNEELVEGPPNIHPKQTLMLTQLHAELLNDLVNSFDTNDSANHKSANPVSWFAKLKYIALACAGLLLAAAQGFDGITTLLGVLPFPPIIILLAGIGFSALSMVLFYSCELAHISAICGVPFTGAAQLLDAYFVQLTSIKGIRKKLSTYIFSRYPNEDLLVLKDLLEVLQKRILAVGQASQQFNQALNNNKVAAAKLFVSTMVGLLFFGGGFFAGQSVAMFIGSLFIASMLPTFWPVILFSTLVGLAALSLYWYVELADVKKLVSSWFGLDEDKIEKLCNKESIACEKEELLVLKNKLNETLNTANELTTLRAKLHAIEGQCISNHSRPLSPGSAKLYTFYAQPSNNVLASNASNELSEPSSVFLNTYPA